MRFVEPLSARRRIEEEEQGPPLMLLDALTLASETLREYGEGNETQQAAKLLEKKAMKLRARQNKMVRWEHHCFCGLPRRETQPICDACFRAIPAKLSTAPHYAKTPKEMKAAQDEIRDFCRLRRERMSR